MPPTKTDMNSANKAIQDLTNALVWIDVVYQKLETEYLAQFSQFGGRQYKMLDSGFSRVSLEALVKNLEHAHVEIQTIKAYLTEKMDLDYPPGSRAAQTHAMGCRIRSAVHPPPPPIAARPPPPPIAAHPPPDVTGDVFRVMMEQLSSWYMKEKMVVSTETLTAIDLSKADPLVHRSISLLLETVRKVPPEIVTADSLGVLETYFKDPQHAGTLVTAGTLKSLFDMYSVSKGMARLTH